MILEFLWRYIAGPIIADAKNAETAVWHGVTAHTGYNPVNTITWGIIAVTLLLLIKKGLEKRNIQLNTRTAISSIPFILLGGILRFLEDIAFLPFVLRPLAITPVIYLLITGLFLGSLAIARKKSSTSKYSRDQLLEYTGYIVLLPFAVVTAFVLFQRADPVLLTVPVLLAVFLTGIYYLGSRSTDYSKKEYVLVVFSQLFGGSVSMISLSELALRQAQNPYHQKQLLTQAFTSIFGIPGVVILKAIIAGTGIYVIEKDLEDAQMKALALIVLYSIGLGTGLRVLLRLSLGI